MRAQVPVRAPEFWSPQTKIMQQFADELVTLAAADIRDARYEGQQVMWVAGVQLSMAPKVL